MNDEEFLRAFELCDIPNESFHHRDHIRLAWIHLRKFGRDEAAVRLKASIRRYAEHHGASGKYHETITIAWVRLLAHCMEQMPPDVSFEDLVGAFPKLLDKSSIGDFYSTALLMSESARHEWVEPDLHQLRLSATGGTPVVK